MSNTIIINSNNTRLFIGKALRAIKDSKVSIGGAVIMKGRDIARSNAPIGVRSSEKSLRGSIIQRYYSNRSEGKIFIRPENNAMALIQEFGIKPTFVSYKGNNNISSWAKSKGFDTTKSKGIMIGKSTGNIALGNPRNAFWDKSFKELLPTIPVITNNIITKKLSRIK